MIDLIYNRVDGTYTVRKRVGRFFYHMNLTRDEAERLAGQIAEQIER